MVEGENNTLGTIHQEPTLDPQLREDVNNLKNQVQEAKNDFLIIFGIFASFVTFLSVEIQVFKTIENFWLIVGMSSFLLAAVLLFAITLSNIAKDKSSWSDFKQPVFVLLYILIAFSFLCFYIGSRGVPGPNRTTSSSTDQLFRIEYLK